MSSVTDLLSREIGGTTRRVEGPSLVRVKVEKNSGKSDDGSLSMLMRAPAATSLLTEERVLRGACVNSGATRRCNNRPIIYSDLRGLREIRRKPNIGDRDHPSRND